MFSIWITLLSSVLLILIFFVAIEGKEVKLGGSEKIRIDDKSRCIYFSKPNNQSQTLIIKRRKDVKI